MVISLMRSSMTSALIGESLHPQATTQDGYSKFSSRCVTLQRSTLPWFEANTPIPTR